MSGTIYRAFDISNNMSYIGQTWYTMEQRKKRHIHDAKKKNDGHFHISLKIRLDAFFWTIETTGIETQIELDNAEINCIRKYESLHPFGYNLAEGGKGCRATEESRKKMSIASLGKKKTAEHARNISLGQIGKTFSKETKKKMSDTKKRKFELRKSLGLPAPNAKPIVCIETGEIFSSSVAAVQKYNFNRSKICDVLKGRRKHTGGFTFAYLEQSIK